MSDIKILPAWRASYRDGVTPVRDGWQIIIDGEWAQTFPTRREAEAAAIRLETQEGAEVMTETRITIPGPKAATLTVAQATGYDHGESAAQIAAWLDANVAAGTMARLRRILADPTPIAECEHGLSLAGRCRYCVSEASR